MRALPLETFAAEAGAPPELVERLVATGAIVALADGRFDARDEVVVSTARALLEAGIGLDDLTWALEERNFGLRALGHLFSEPQPRTTRRYADLAVELREDASHLSAVYAAFELPEPEPDDHPRADEVEAVAEFVSLWSLVDPTGQAHVRVARLIGDATRRVAEGWLDLWDEVARPGATTQGAPTVGPAAWPADPADPAQNVSIAMADVARRLVSLVHERQTETALTARIIGAVERLLDEGGRLPARSRRPPAIAFVDLAGFTSLTEERGDEEAARVATRLHDLADAAARARGGRVVKQLGDGVLLRFEEPGAALSGVGEVVRGTAESGLPAARAGIAAGPVIVRDGDVFGRTVNLAARLAAVAKPSETLVEEGMVVALPKGTATFEPVGRIDLRGVPEPVAVWRVVATQGASRG